MASIIDGNAAAVKLKAFIRQWNLSNLTRQPNLLIISTNEQDSASKVYVNNKVKAAAEVGINALHYVVSEDQYNHPSFIQQLDKRIAAADAVILQLPVAPWCKADFIMARIPASKDVDGLGVIQTGMMRQYPSIAYQPCTPCGIMYLLGGNPAKGRTALVIGRSNLVGRPISELLLQKDWTVTTAHSGTPKPTLCDLFARADLVVAATGKPNLLTEYDAEQHFKDNRHDPYGDFCFKRERIIIDVGINRDGNNKLCGDFSEEFKQKYSTQYTPVPGGVGPMTVAMLMLNTSRAAYNQLHQGEPLDEIPNINPN